jgi:signal transduction histidine kinase
MSERLGKPGWSAPWSLNRRRGVRCHVLLAARAASSLGATAWVSGAGAVWSWMKTNLMSRPVGDDGVTDGRAPVFAAEPVTGPGLYGKDSGSRGSSTNSRVPGRGRPSRRGLKNWRVRSRLLLLIAIPTLTALVFGGVGITSAVQSAVTYQRVEERAVLAFDIAQLAQRLETERDQTVYYIALGSNGGRAGDLSKAAPAAAKSGAAHQYGVLQAFYRQTDQVLAQVSALLAQFRGNYSSATQPEVASALTELNDLKYLRQASAKSQLYPLAVVQKYADLIDNLIAVEDQTGQGTGDPVLSQTAAVLGPVSRMKEEASEQRAILSAALLRGSLSQADTSAFNVALANQQSNQQTFDLSATAPQREQWDNTVSGSFINLAASQEQQAAMLQAHHSLVGDPLTAGGFYDSMSNGIANQMGSVERTLATDIITRSDSLRRSAVIYAILVGLAVFTVLTLALMLTVLVGRSIARPLQRLQMGALEVAGVRLPETVRRMSEQGTADVPEAERIDVDSSDEIGEVARAFDQVHREAVRLAGNEAALRGSVNAMFVNLSRRSQSLVERQIRLIDDLEQGEQQPERLANLFQMDHLATRMRRNCENLLVLAGHDMTRRWTQAVALVDVVRAAMSEIEQYERVTLDVQPGISVRGHAVNDVVHLLSELVENATSFSTGETPVSVSAHLLNGGGVLFAITDQGVGMGAEEMAHANWRLDNPPVVDVAVSRRMGLFVVARLGARHGIRVRLRPASVNGLTALVWLPDEVISHETAASPPAPRQADPPGPAVPAVPAMRSRLTDWPTIGQPDEHSVALAAPTAASTPRFTPLRPEAGDTVPSSAQEAEELPAPDGPLSGTAATAETGPGSALRSDGPAMPSFGSQPGPERQDVIVPPVVSAGEDNRLPIFESVESDWFHRRHGAVGSAPAETRPADDWESPADEGWRAAEVANAPVSDGMTVAGLPIRVPKANLIPGSVGATLVPTQRAPSRFASHTRERLASFQRGTREGRAATRDDEISRGEG